MSTDSERPSASFAELHAGPVPLLLPNAWDVTSALAFAEAGFAAVGTTSFGVNAAQGKPDLGGASRDATRELVHRLRALPAYLSVDIEDGYSDDPAEIATFIDELSVAGVNIEDSKNGALVDVALHAAKLAAVKAAVPHVFLNARIDTYWFGIQATPEETLERAKAFVDAGADGIFVPGAAEPKLLERLAADIQVPVNVLVTPGLSLAQLGDLGIRRVSTGSLPYRVAIDAAVRVATTIRDGGHPESATPYGEAQHRLEAYAQSLAALD
ncbi:MAG: isocitrate lyase/PEP mutase family protein [Humibacter sp.]